MLVFVQILTARHRELAWGPVAVCSTVCSSLYRYCLLATASLRGGQSLFVIKMDHPLASALPHLVSTFLDGIPVFAQILPARHRGLARVQSLLLIKIEYPFVLALPLLVSTL